MKKILCQLDNITNSRAADNSDHIKTEPDMKELMGLIAVLINNFSLIQNGVLTYINKCTRATGGAEIDYLTLASSAVAGQVSSQIIDRGKAVQKNMMNKASKKIIY